MSVALIEPFDRWFLSLSKGSGTTRRNDSYTKCGGFDKLNHRNANLLDSLKEIGWYEKSCGFICGKEDLATWNTLEVAKISLLWGYWKNYN